MSHFQRGKKKTWWVELMVNGIRERGPALDYAFLWPSDQPMPERKPEWLAFEGLIRRWVLDGRPKPQPPAPPEGAKTESGVTIQQALDAYDTDSETHKEDNGYATQVRRLGERFGKLPIDMLLDRATMVAYLSPLDEHIPSRNRHFSRWTALISFCRAQYGLEGKSPVYNKTQGNTAGPRKKYEGPGRSRRLHKKPLDEEKVLLRVFTKLAKADGGMMLGRFYCALDLGIRKKEMLSIRKKDIFTTEEEGLCIRVHWTTAKTRKERIVSVNSARLRKWLKTRRFADFTFGQADGTRCDTFRVDWENALLDAGIDKGHWVKPKVWEYTVDGELHWHDLRHECGSRLARGGMHQKQIMVRLGHSKLEQTEKYINPTAGEIAKEARRIAKASGW